MRLDGKVAIITGSTKGIGRVIAATMAAEGAKVVLAGRTEKRGAEMVAAIKAAGGEATFVATDVSKEEDIRHLVDVAVSTYGGLTTLVNNAASTDLINTADNTVVDITLEAWDALIRATLTGAMLMAKYSIPRMIEAGGGSIVNISSESSKRPDPQMTAYAAAKAAMNSLSRSIAVQHGADNIRCNTVLTGMILPPQSVPMFDANPRLGPKLHAQHLTRIGRREDIAWGVVYLASDESGFVTGAELPIDGGAPIISNMMTKREIFEGQ
ncbi:MAG: cpnA 2 [Acidimicrobiia bacterium]|nr:cpnA 2 [Acidimicrobiia bacterium]